MRSKWRVGLASVAVLATVGSLACFTAQSSGAETSASAGADAVASQGQSTDSDQPPVNRQGWQGNLELGAAASEVAQYLQTHADASQFTGVAVSPQGADLYIVGAPTGKTNAAIEAAKSIGLEQIAAAGQATTASHVPVIVHQATRTLLELDRVRDQITADRVNLVKSGIHLVGYYIDAKNSKVMMQVTDPSASDIASLDLKYGDAIEVENQAPFTVVTCPNRTCDQQPYRGGDATITYSDYIANTAYCTAAFSYQNTNTTPPIYAQVTAGHCASDSTSGNLNDVYAANSQGQTPPLMGHTWWKYFGPNAAFDAAGFSVTSVWSSQIWRNQVAQGTRHVSSSLNPTTNESDLCTDGSNNGQICYWTVVNADGSYQVGFTGYPTYWIDHEAEIVSDDGTQTGCTGGDSGGPVYWPLSNDRAQAKGIISAGNGAGHCLITPISYINDTMALDGYQLIVG